MHIERLTPNDLAGCVGLAVDRDWQPEEPKWRLLFGVGDAYGVRDEQGGLAGCAVLTRYGPSAAVLSNLLVARRHERQGIGAGLVRHVLAAAAPATTLLYATTEGRELYRRLGFEDVRTANVWVGRFGLVRVDSPRSRPAISADLGPIVKLDSEVYGVDRAHMLARLFSAAEQVRVLEEDGEIVGYATRYASDDWQAIGPVVAPDEDGAQALITDLAEGAEGPVRIDLLDDQRNLGEWLTGCGLATVYQATFMRHGSIPEGRPAQMFAPVGHALG
ncbi:N-acetyltransferase [Pseudonocardiaceae bacterium YIM PH 21723]|nr:N-acetyltransferase [Pseudonocardiaceae bacterium YIM PH 21723]